MNKIFLPSVAYRKYSTPLLYGAEVVIKNYVGMNIFPKYIYGEWQHGAIYNLPGIYPEHINEGNSENKNNPTWTFNCLQESLLLQSNYKAKAIGAPILYLPELQIPYKRISGTLLIFPAHSSFNIHAYNSSNESVKKYLSYIKKIKKHFDYVAVCLHSECLRRNLWVNEFKDLSIEIIQGADVRDTNSLERMRALMSQFEFVTSNQIGSHIAYASFFGSKVSLAGPLHNFELDAVLLEPFYKKNSHLASWIVDQNKLAMQKFAFLHTNPWEAMSNKKWAGEQLGIKNILKPEEMKRLFKLNDMSQLFLQAKHALKRKLLYAKWLLDD
jgi:hypothetical protein